MDGVLGAARLGLANLVPGDHRPLVVIFPEVVELKLLWIGLIEVQGAEPPELGRSVQPLANSLLLRCTQS